MFNCETCALALNDKKELIAHFWHKHRQNGYQTVLDFYYDGQAPFCACGCGEPTLYSKHVQDYNKFLTGHNSAVGENNFKKSGGEAKSAATKKKRSAEGAYKGKSSPELLARYSERSRGEGNAMYGKQHKQESKDKIRDAQLASYEAKPERKEFLREVQAKVWDDQEKRDAARQRMTDRLKANSSSGCRYKSVLEQDFEAVLIEMGIDFENQKEVLGYLFDFYIPSKNLLIEVDGDFYHVNPALHLEPKYPVQRDVLKNDAKKNKLAAGCGYHLERFWESDVRKDLSGVKQRLRDLME